MYNVLEGGSSRITDQTLNSQNGDDLDITELAALSPRIRMLKKLAAEDDPIKNMIATELVTNKTWLRTGLLFEFAMCFLFPFLRIWIYIVDWSGQDPYEINTHIIWPIGFNNAGLGFIGWIVAGILSTLVVISPGRILVKAVGDVKDLQNVPITHDHAISSFFEIQRTSFLYPWYVNIAVGALLSFLTICFIQNDGGSLANFRLSYYLLVPVVQSIIPVFVCLGMSLAGVWLSLGIKAISITGVITFIVINTGFGVMLVTEYLSSYALLSEGNPGSGLMFYLFLILSLISFFVIGFFADHAHLQLKDLFMPKE